MIILSQDEEMIVNFDNAKVLRTAFYSNCVGIKAVLDKENDFLLGMYKDEARAEEVLKEILDWIADKDGEECKIFYMPKE